ncbi:hypothetical protein ACIPYQ_07775 [Streptomyces sp. NPDC090045]|uniref:hypothetical protein n=1 Tax=Streptomyces sp. NPDC090045 TaxID=3365927 RepID=UPI00382308F5
MNDGPKWPVAKLTALRLGRRLVTEVPASRPDRRAFVDITPANSSYRLTHWEYDGERIEGFDYDIGATLIKSATATNEQDLTTTLTTWHLHPALFDHPWNTEDPR